MRRWGWGDGIRRGEGGRGRGEVGIRGVGAWVSVGVGERMQDAGDSRGLGCKKMMIQRSLNSAKEKSFGRSYFPFSP